MSTIAALVAVYVGFVSLTQVVVVARLLARRDERAYHGRWRGRLWLQLLVGAVDVGLAIVTLVSSHRLVWAVPTVVLAALSSWHAKWLAAHDDSPPPPPLARHEAQQLRDQSARSRKLLLATAALQVPVIPATWVLMGWQWGLGLLLLSIPGLYIGLIRMPRLTERAIARRGVEE